MDVRACAAPFFAGAFACVLHACTLSTAGIPTGGAGGEAMTSTTIGGGGNTTSSTASTGRGGDSTSSTGPMEPDPTCADGSKNGLETDIDCGGDACAPCAPGKSCALDLDCVTLACQGGSCAAMPANPGCMPGDQPTCNDCLKNGLETDLDCGGDDCPPCGPGGACTSDADCDTLGCESGVCAALPVDHGCEPSDQPTCNDCLKNGLETGIDCGGDACPPCGPGGTCFSDGDCATAHCSAGVCSPGQ